MKFSEKLTKLRKENGLSQEDLADKLDVSRQSVSKWELGTTYPEMDKLLTMCKIFNVTLDDLTNDEVDFKEVNNKKKNYFDSMMDDITHIIDNSYNMFKSMNGKQLAKVLFELFIIFIVLLFCRIPFEMIAYDGADLIATIPTVGNFFGRLWECIINLAYVALFIFTYLYIYKSQFLDKYEKEDKKVEEVNEEATTNNEVKKESVVRETKDSSTSGALFKTIKGIVIFFFKVFLLTLFIPAIFFLVGLSVAFFIMLYLIIHGVFYFGFIVSIIGLIILCGLFIRILYSGISDYEINLKSVFATGIIGLIIVGCGFGLSAIDVSKTKFINDIPSNNMDVYTKTYEYSSSDNIIISDNAYNKEEYVVDENLKDKVIVEIKYFNRLMDVDVDTFTRGNYKLVDFDTNAIFSKDVFDIAIEGLKKHTIYNYTKLYTYNVVIKSSKSNIDKMSKNTNDYYRDLSNHYNERQNNEDAIEELESRVIELENINNSLKDENEVLKDKINSYKEAVNNL